MVDMQGILSLFDSRFFPCPAEMSGFARKYINCPHKIRHKKQPLETGKITLLILKRFVSQCYSEFLVIACYPCV